MPGAERLRDCAALVDLFRAQQQQGKLCAAICATPVVMLQSHGLLEGRAATAHPAFSDKLPDQRWAARAGPGCGLGQRARPGGGRGQLRAPG